MRPVVGQCASMGPRPGGHGKTDRPPGKGLSISGGRKPEHTLRSPESPPLKKVTITPCNLRLAVDNGDRWGARPRRPPMTFYRIHRADESPETVLDPTRPDGWVASDEGYETQ